MALLGKYGTWPLLWLALIIVSVNSSPDAEDGISEDTDDSPWYREIGARDTNSDIEVLLRPNPMISPDIVIGKFTDSKVSLSDRIIEASKYLNSKLNSSTEATTTATQDLDTLLNEIDDSVDQSQEDDSKSDENTDMLDEPAGEGDDPNGNQDDPIFDPDHDDLSIIKHSDDRNLVQVKKIKEGEPCHIQMNATSGSFQMNFDDDCTVLLTTPMLRARVILHCENMHLPSCTRNKEALTVNLKGDMKFGRNSYFYCGDSQIRTTSISKRISIRIKSTPNLKQSVRCHFFGRQQRVFNFGREPANAQTGTQIHTLCGRLGRSSKIVGGRKVPPGLFPWAAQLDISRADGSQTACTGSVVADKYVLTAAHCLKNAESISVYMGGADRLEFTGTEVAIQAEKYILHRRWNPKSLTADIALVKLSEPVKFTEEVSPICLQEPESLLGLGLIRRESWAGKTGVSVGWGRLTTKETAPRKLYRVKLPFLNDNKCSSIYSTYFQKRTMLCTDSNEQAAICYGDSGGPLMYKRKDVVYQVGVASFSLSRKCGESPDVFTKVSEYASWIKTRVKIDT